MITPYLKTTLLVITLFTGTYGFAQLGDAWEAGTQEIGKTLDSEDPDDEDVRMTKGVLQMQTNMIRAAEGSNKPGTSPKMSDAYENGMGEVLKPLEEEDPGDEDVALMKGAIKLQGGIIRTVENGIERENNPNYNRQTPVQIGSEPSSSEQESELDAWEKEIKQKRQAREKAEAEANAKKSESEPEGVDLESMNKMVSQGNTLMAGMLQQTKDEQKGLQASIKSTLDEIERKKAKLSKSTDEEVRNELRWDIHMLALSIDIDKVKMERNQAIIDSNNMVPSSTRKMYKERIKELEEEKSEAKSNKKSGKPFDQ